jgi:transposase
VIISEKGVDMNGRDFKPEFKQFCCKLVVNDGKKMPEVYKQYNLDKQTLHRWVAEYRELGKDAFKGSMVTRAALIKKLERENRKQQEEIEILKKAIAYCKQKKSD